MKKLIGLLLICSLSVSAQPNSLNIAKRFCSNNSECIDVISLELDSAYFAGVRDSKPGNPSSLIAKRQNKLSNLCDSAPSKNICDQYRDELISYYIQGLAKG